jgi:hypothetical protein
MRHRIALLLALLLALGLLAPAGAAPLPASVAKQEADERCLLGDDDTPFGVGACPGVRPGAMVRAPEGVCTFNYVVTGAPIPPAEGPTRTFIGTAGHCVLGSAGERAWASGTGPVVQDANRNEVGRVVYARLGEGADYALIEPDRGITVDPSVCHFGGPTGVAGPSSDTYVVVQHSGQGTVLGSTIPGRSHVARWFDDPQQVRFDGPVTIGDSGAPLNRNRQAVGIVVTLGANSSGLIRALRLGPQLRRAGEVLGLRMSLVTADASASEDEGDA